MHPRLTIPSAPALVPVAAPIFTTDTLVLAIAVIPLVLAFSHGTLVGISTISSVVALATLSISARTTAILAVAGILASLSRAVVAGPLVRWAVR